MYTNCIEICLQVRITERILSPALELNEPGHEQTRKKNKTSEPRSRGKGALRVYNKLREDILRMELLPG